MKIWQAHGGLKGALGLPTSNIGPIGTGFRQDFKGGYITADYLAKAIIVHTVANPSGELPHTSLKRHILRQADATA